MFHRKKRRRDFNRTLGSAGTASPHPQTPAAEEIRELSRVFASFEPGRFEVFELHCASDDSPSEDSHV